MEAVRVKVGVLFHPDTVGSPVFWAMAKAAQDVAPKGYSVTITSGMDGAHEKWSKHYYGWAIDFRVRDFPGVICKKVWSGEPVYTYGITGEKILNQWANRIERQLGNLYIVRFEPKKIHIHAQLLEVPDGSRYLGP